METRMIKAHPTTYAGTKFRSRLEARWAAFFDLLGWQWQYEPVDLNGWTPDFAIRCKDGPVYVEVKPIEWVGTNDDNNKQVKSRADLAKVFAYFKSVNEPREVLVLGTAPSFITHKRDQYCTWGFLGSILWPTTQGDTPHVDTACLFKPKTGFDFCAYYGSYHFRIDGEYDGDHHLHGAGVDENMVEKLWREASNRVQWKAAA